MPAFRPHQRQFVLGPQAVKVWPDWTTIRVTDGLILSVCPKLSISKLHSRDGVIYYLLGFAVLSDRPMTSIHESFHSKDSSEIEEWTGFWAGKWVLISAKCVWPDATGAVGIHYRKVGNTVWISSSPPLLSDYLPNIPSEPYIAWQVRHRNGMDWIPAPFTTRENIYKVMPLRTITPLNGIIVPVRFSAASNNGNTNDESLASAVKNIMINWARADFQDRYVSLTAGMDTRLLLAAARAASLKLEARTIAYPGASKSDLSMPPRLAATVGIPHKIMRSPTQPLTLTEIMDRASAIVAHMDGATYHPQSAALAHGLEDFMNDSTRTMTGGQIFGVGRCFFWRRFAKFGLGETLPSADQVLDAFFTHSYDPYPFWSCHPRARWREAFQLWLDSLSEPRALNLDWREAFHLDQAIGAWGGTLHRLVDIYDGSYFPPGSCLWVLHLLVRDPIHKKQQAFAQRNAIRLLSPALANFPTNPPSVAARMKRAVKTLLGKKGIDHLKSALKKPNLR